jgi:hypothetical protein
MDWYSVGIAAVCGGVAGAIGAMAASVFKKKQAKAITSAVITVVLFMALFGWAKETIIADHAEQATLAKFESLIVGNPAYKSIQEFAPETMTEVRNYIKLAVSEKHDYSTVEATTRQIIASVIGTRLPKASDAAILNAIQLTVDQMRLLRERNDGSCFRFLFPHVDGGIRALDVFSQELMDRDYASTSLILSTYDDTRELPEERDAREVLSPIYEALFQKYAQEAVAEMADVTADGIDKSRICSISLDLYEMILALEDKDAVTALRWMFE